MILNDVPYERIEQFYIYIFLPIPPKPIGNDYRKMIGKCKRLFAVVFFGSNHPPFSAIKENPLSKFFKYIPLRSLPQSTHRVATATFWPTYISSWWKNYPRLVRLGGARPPPFTLSTLSCGLELRVVPAERADTLPLFLLYPYLYSAVLPFLVSRSPHPP
jgi:hypothetical protein